MITIKHLDHISMGHADWKAQSAFLGKILGFKHLGSWDPGESDFDGCTMQVPGTDIEFEIISPVGERSFVQKFLDEQGPGLHHITIEVASIEEAAAELQRLGLTPFGGITDDGAWRITYIHPKESGGILWQLFEPYKFPGAHDRTTTPGEVGVKRVDHVSMATKDLDKQIAWQERVFGMELLHRWTDEHLGYNGAVMRIPNSQLEFEMMEPTRPDSFVQKFIDTRRAGMHHICIDVESADKAAEGLRANGITPFGGVIESDWKRHTFLHPKDSGGVLFQLAEA
ncbi:MAG: VOC family protein [Dehalococcoidia bacterium]|nr:VOC family protein [Dehalococcoidia bacterium]